MMCLITEWLQDERVQVENMVELLKDIYRIWEGALKEKK